MDFPTAVRTCLSKYATFAGRARRAEYWWFALFGGLVGFGALAVDALLLLRGSHGPGGNFSPFQTLSGLVLLLPNLAVTVRRLHDRGRSGWWLLIGIVPLVGAIVLLVWLVKAGTRGPNRYGPDPIGPDGYSDASS